MSGIKNAGGTYDVCIRAEDDNMYGLSDLRTILLKNGDEFIFISNEMIGSEEIKGTDSQYDETYMDEHAEELWDILYKEKFSFTTPIEMRHGLGAVFSVVLDKGVESYDDNTSEMPYESIVSLEDYDGNGSFQFKWHKDYYDGEELFGEKTLGWYWVNERTGEVTQSP